MRRFGLLVLTLLAIAAANAVAQETLDNPEYATWKKYKKGTSITTKTTSVSAGQTAEILSTTTLVEVGDDKMVVEMTGVTKAAGMEFKVPPTKRDIPKTYTLPKGTAKPDANAVKPPGTFDEGTETLKIAGVEMKTKWYKFKSETAGLKTESKMWVCEDVPGSMVKMEATTSGTFASESKIEVIEFKKP